MWLHTRYELIFEILEISYILSQVTIVGAKSNLMTNSNKFLIHLKIIIFAFVYDFMRWKFNQYLYYV